MAPWVQRFNTAQQSLKGVAAPKTDVAEAVLKVVEHLEANLIQIPRIIVGLKPGSEGTYQDFDLDPDAFPPIQPVAHDILIQSLRDGDQTFLNDMGDGVVRESSPEKYVLRKMVEFDQVNYDRDKVLLNKLASQVVTRYRGLLKDEEALHNVLLYQARFLATKIIDQLDGHFVEPKAEFDVTVTRGYSIPESTDYESDSAQILPLRTAVSPISLVTKKVFGYFKKCMYLRQKFDSNPERVLAIVLENDAQVTRWARPLRDLLRIHVSTGEYRPDFVAETGEGKWVIEVKAHGELEDPKVLEKKLAAERWCEAATANDGQEKPWKYVLLSENDVKETATFTGLMKLVQL